jgi:predicted aldo/keto reductase-like oxidoreductase
MGFDSTLIFQDKESTDRSVGRMGDEKMNRMVLGKTGLEVCRMGFGGIPIQRVEEKQAVEAVLHAVENGADFIDTSRMYTTSETRIGKALQLTRRKVTLATKSYNRTSDGIRKDVETSLKELQTDYIDLYQAHGVSNPKDYEGVIAPGGALEGLRKAKEDGLIGHVGITSHSLDLLLRIIEDAHFETIMTCYSFLEPAAGDRVIPRAREKNIGVIAMKSFSGGVIQNPALALKFSLAKPDVLLIPGIESKELFDENWRIFEGNHELSPPEWQEIEAIRKQYDKNFCRRCDYCQPCSEGISIQYALGLKDFAKRMGKAQLKSPGMQHLIGKARNCSECGECLARCPYELAIPDLIKENLAWVDSQI